jgi:hypothetical protein
MPNGIYAALAPCGWTFDVELYISTLLSDGGAGSNGYVRASIDARKRIYACCPSVQQRKNLKSRSFVPKTKVIFCSLRPFTQL